MSDLNRIEQNNAELRECIQIAESLPDAPETVNGYDIATMQKFVDSRGLSRLYIDNAYPNGILGMIDNGDIGWLTQVDTSKATTAHRMFSQAKFYNNYAVPLFDTSNVVDMSYMFSSDNQDINAYKGYIVIPNFDTRNAKKMSYMLQYRRLQSFPLFSYDSATETDSVFYNVTFKTSCEVPNLHLPQTTSMKSFFAFATNLTKCGNITAPLCTSMQGLFRYSDELQSVGDITANQDVAINFAEIFQRCKVLTSVGRLNFIPSSISNTFNECELLDNISLDLRDCTSTSSAFSYCKALTNLTLKNIKVNLQVGSGDGSSTSHYGYLLTVDSLVGLCYELRDTGSVKTLTIGSANLEKLASVYVRSIEITDEMRAEDDLIDEKLPFERCESTDEGATLIGDYILAKNWKLA